VSRGGWWEIIISAPTFYVWELTFSSIVICNWNKSERKCHIYQHVLSVVLWFCSFIRAIVNTKQLATSLENSSQLIIPEPFFLCFSAVHWPRCICDTWHISCLLLIQEWTGPSHNTRVQLPQWKFLHKHTSKAIQQCSMRDGNKKCSPSFVSKPSEKGCFWELFVWVRRKVISCIIRTWRFLKMSEAFLVEPACTMANDIVPFLI
jgi:hypothetical protein